MSSWVANIFELDGSASTDADSDALTYLWTVVSKPEGSNPQLIGADTMTPTFIADLEGTYEIQLIVNDGYSDSTPDIVVIGWYTQPGYAQQQISGAQDIVIHLPLDHVTTRGNQVALGRMLLLASAALGRGNIEKGVTRLNRALARTDGCPERGGPDPGPNPAKDYITDCDDQYVVYALIREALLSLGY